MSQAHGTISVAATDPEAGIVAFLRDTRNWPGSWRPDSATADVIETHGARVFLSGETALKARRHVKLPYLDFTALEARLRFAKRELELNQPTAPDLYLDIVAISRSATGALTFGDTGEVVDWVVRMRRFHQTALLSEVAETTGIAPALAAAIGDMVAANHRTAPRMGEHGDTLAVTAQSILSALGAGPGQLRGAVRELGEDVARSIGATAPLRSSRARDGFVRRCHGDLHLGNIVIWRGFPVPFDAIEFDERLATIDTLYDLAFLLMDLDRRSQKPAANLVLNRYLWRTGDCADIEGLAALPLFLALRAAVRAVVALDRARVGAEPGRDLAQHAATSVALARDYLRPQPARLVAIGGLSGTGKSTLAAALAPLIGRVPGALHIRTDLERKALAGVEVEQHLPAAAYTPDQDAAVYRRVMMRARLALAAGHSVVVDGVLSKPLERSAIEDLAGSTGAVFKGLWLEAPPDTMRARVTARRGDASDATAVVVDRQLGYDSGVITWTRLDASPEPELLAVAARDVLAV